MITQAGTYPAKLASAIVIYETERGALCAAVPCTTAEGPIKHTLTLIKSDGTVNTRTLDTCKQVFGWDGIDPFWLSDNYADLAAKEFEIVVEMEQGMQNGTPVTDENGQPVLYPKVKWLNPVGGGPGMKMPDPADRRSVLTKYGSKFRALAGGTPVKPPTKPAPPTPPKPPGAPPPPAPAAQTATMEQAWQALWEANPAIAQADAEKRWQDAIAAEGRGRPASSFTPEDWGRVKSLLTDHIPM